MRVDLKTLMDSLGVGRLLHAYETQPWMVYDDEKEITCAAEVRVGPGAVHIEAEIQFLYDDPEKHEKTNPEQIMLLRAMPVKGGEWQIERMWLKGEDYVNKIGGWDVKSCAFFKACVQAIVMGDLPDIEALIKTELADDSRRGGSGRIGRKSPKADTAAMLGLKQKP